MMGPRGNDESLRLAVCKAFERLLAELCANGAPPDLQRIALDHGTPLWIRAQQNPTSYLTGLDNAIQQIAMELNAGLRVQGWQARRYTVRGSLRV
jgi:hypothetical protein